MNMMTASEMNGSAKGMQSRWLRSTVSEFFSSVNWDNRPLQVTDSQTFFDTHLAPSSPAGTTETQTLGLDMRMSVESFFNQLPWEGKPAIAEPISLSEFLIEEEEEVTLDDFFGNL